MKRKLSLAVLGLLVSTGVFAQQAAAPNPYTPNKDQQQRLTIAQKDLTIAQLQFQQAYNTYLATAEQVRQENKWAPEVKFDAQSGNFFLPKTSAQTAPVPADPPKEKPKQ